MSLEQDLRRGITRAADEWYVEDADVDRPLRDLTNKELEQLGKDLESLKYSYEHESKRRVKEKYS